MQTYLSVGGHGEHELEVHSRNAPERGLTHRADSFRPAEAFLDALARGLIDGVSRMACATSIDGGVALGARVPPDGKQRDGG